ncbi:hypothetical protein HPB49_018931 [Dermacentor silvarum]|uniref:Uncharacterized protein n=1 Tax=Dermacentor silvarum TaxID=543639 RepID=A0ACB8D778_DERSI|nr:hypothetical protein HPB49_018931 [Dermacentor silvarum]
MEVVVEGEIISPEGFKADAGWMESHRQKRAKILEDLNVEARKDNKNKNQDAEQREAARGRPRHRKQPQTLRLPELPKDDIKIILRPKEGLNVSKTSHVSLRDSILNAAGIHVNDAIIHTLRTNNFKNIIMISTPDMARARRYNGIKAIVIQGKRKQTAESWVIFTYSRVALPSLKSPRKQQQLVMDIRRLCNKACELHHSVVLQWLAAHRGIQGKV